MALRFGEIRLDRETRQLFRRSEPIHLTPKAFDLLRILVEARPKAIPKAELLRRLWPVTFVAEANVAVLIREIRMALGDSARSPEYVRTVSRYGYAFAAIAVDEAERSLSPEPQPSRLWLAWEAHSVRLAVGDNPIGRDPTYAIWLDLPSVSRRHAVIVVDGGQATLEDLGSKNGTYLRGVRVTGREALRHGDVIDIGTARLVFREGQARETGTVSAIEAPPLETADR